MPIVLTTSVREPLLNLVAAIRPLIRRYTTSRLNDMGTLLSSQRMHTLVSLPWNASLAAFSSLAPPFGISQFSANTSSNQAQASLWLDRSIAGYCEPRFRVTSHFSTFLPTTHGRSRAVTSELRLALFRFSRPHCRIGDCGRRHTRHS